MGRRKNYMDDGQDSSDEEGGRISFNVTEDDLESEMAGFSGSRQRRQRSFEDDSSDEEDARGGLGAGNTSSLAASFLPTSFQASSGDASPKPKKDPVKQKVKSSMSFNRSGSSTPPPSSGFGEFNKHSKGFGKKMLEKMGWSVGKGLGAEGTGIVNPIETKLRPARMGLSFKGFDERTDQAKAEDKFRQGSDSEQEEEEEQKPKRRNAWKEDGSKKQQSKKRKTIYKTAAQIIEETQHIPVSDSKVIDMTGPSIREIDISEIRRTDSPTLMETSSRFPELRHNLQLLMDLAKGDLENLARETKSSTLKMSTMQAELAHDQKSLDDQGEELKKVEKLQEITQQLERISRDALGTGAYNTGNITALFGECFDVLEREFVNEIGRFEIDHIVIAVWAPVLKYNSVTWNVLENPTFGLLDVKRWRKLLRSNDDEKAANGWTSRAQQTDLVCTPFETMLNTIWLSKVRSAIK
jgi:tuftelin-interacting protein 11